MTLNFNAFLRWIGVATGILGAVLISFDITSGWFFWIPSNLALIWLFYRSPDMTGLPVMYVVYLLTTFNGIYTHYVF